LSSFCSTRLVSFFGASLLLASIPDIEMVAIIIKNSNVQEQTQKKREKNENPVCLHVRD